MQADKTILTTFIFLISLFTRSNKLDGSDVCKDCCLFCFWFLNFSSSSWASKWNGFGAEAR